MIGLQITKASASGFERDPEAVHWLIVSVPLGDRLNAFLVVCNRSVWAFVLHETLFHQSRENRTDGVCIQAELFGDCCWLPPSTSGHHSCFFFLVKKQHNLLGIGPLFELVDIDGIIRHRLMSG
jgi:hypothetical protein